MASADVQILGTGAKAAPLDYNLPSGSELLLKAVRADFDGSGASGDFLPALEIISDAGHSVGVYPTDVAVLAGGSASVSFAPFLRNAPAAAANFLTQIWWYGDVYNGGGTAQTIPNSVFTQLTLNNSTGPNFGDGAKVEFDGASSSVRFTHSVAAGDIVHVRLSGVWAASASTKILQLRFAGINGAFYRLPGGVSNTTYRPTSTVVTDTGYQELITFISPFTYPAGARFDVTAWAFQSSGGNLDFDFAALEVYGPETVNGQA